MSYIEREAAIKAIENDCLEAVYYTKRDAIDCIEAQPTADMVEVVRCKDCIFCKESEVTNSFYCDWHREYFETYPNDYCSYGERREENEG